MNLSEIREKYPEYDSLPDQELAERLYQKHYADVMTFEEFANRITVPAEAQQPAAAPRTVGERMARPFGLTARYLAEGLGETADIFTNPLRAGLQQVPGLGDRFQESTSEGVRRLMDKYGVPAPESPAEEVVGTASKLVAGTGPFVGVGQRLAAGAPGGMQRAGEILSTGPGMQAATAASAAAGGEAVRQEGGGPGSQLIASLVAGMAPAGAKMLADKAAKLLGPTAAKFAKADEILSQYDMAGVPLGIVQNLRDRVQQALRVGEVDGAALQRMIDYAKTGATPTRAKISRDPAEWSQQENLTRQAANSTDPNVNRLAELKGENLRALADGLDDIAKGTSLDLYKAGEATIESISKRNDQRKAIQSALYDKARDSEGRSLPLRRDEFAERVDINLRRENLNQFLPAEIRGLVNEIAYGVKSSKGEKFEVPFNVDVIDQLETVLATAQRGTKDGNVKRAIGAVKQALLETDIEAPRGVELADESLKAFRRARRYSRKLFEWQKKSPAIKAIVDGDATPEKFVDEFVIGNTKKASVDNLAKTMKEITDPEVKALLRVHVGAWIREQATNKQPVDMNSFSQARLLAALNKIGDRKLDIIFGTKDRKQLRAVARVGALEQVPPGGAAVNYSNTATTAMAGFANWLERKTSFLPGADLFIRQPARAVSQWREGKSLLDPQILREGSKPSVPYVIPLGVAGSRSVSGNALERDREDDR